MATQSSDRALALAFVLPPYRDRAALVAASWLGSVARVQQLDVLTASLDRFRHRDDGSLELLPEVGRRLEVAIDNPPQTWASCREFLERGLERLASDPGDEPYAALLSPVPTGHSVLLGAALRDQFPQSRWVVLVAEPSFTAYDRVRMVVPEDCPTRALMGRLLESRGLRVPESSDGAVWLERLTVAVADEVVVLTTAHRDALVAAHGDDLRAEVTVSRLTPPAEAMYAGDVPVGLDLRDAVLDVGWFDDDPTQPELVAVLESLRSLPAEVRRDIRLHLVSERPQLLDRLVPTELAGCVHTVCVTDVRPRLAAMRAMDVVLALEAGSSGAGRGPRWSWVEAVGSGSRVVGVGPRAGSLAELVPSDVVPNGHVTAIMQLFADLARHVPVPASPTGVDRP